MAQQNHHSKFFQPGSPDNVPPGTIVDNIVCHLRNYDFYICSHAGMIGTTRSTHYHVLHDEIGFAAAQMGQLMKFDDKYLASVHIKKYFDLIRSISSKEFDSQRLKIASKFNSIYFNKGSSEAGLVVEPSVRVVTGDLNSSMTIVRPPGNHAEPNEAMGFCLFNNVAVVANVLLNERPKLVIKKNVDWDVHHGCSTQKVFYNDPQVLFFSVHKFDFGSFYLTGGDRKARGNFKERLRELGGLDVVIGCHSAEIELCLQQNFVKITTMVDEVQLKFVFKNRNFVLIFWLSKD